MSRELLKRNRRVTVQSIKDNEILNTSNGNAAAHSRYRRLSKRGELKWILFISECFEAGEVTWHARKAFFLPVLSVATRQSMFDGIDTRNSNETILCLTLNTFVNKLISATFSRGKAELNCHATLLLGDVTGTLNACYLKLISTFRSHFNSRFTKLVYTSILLLGYFLKELLISESSSSASS